MRIHCTTSLADLMLKRGVMQDIVDNDMPCSLCGRCYQHEHIRSVYQAPPASDSSDSGDSS